MMPPENEQLTKLHETAPSLLDATQIATIFLDRRLCITHFTPVMMGLFGLREADIGRPITDIAGRLSYANLPTDAATVLYKQEIVERQMQAPEGVGTLPDADAPTPSDRCDSRGRRYHVR